MAEAKVKVKFDYYKIKKEDMVNYIKTYHNDDESKKAFKAAAYVQKTKTKYAQVMENGQPVFGIGASGKPYIKRKKLTSEVTEGVTYKQNKAKAYFYETYKDEIEWSNLPKTKKDKVINAIDEELLSW